MGISLVFNGYLMAVQWVYNGDYKDYFLYCATVHLYIKKKVLTIAIFLKKVVGSVF